MAVTIILAVAVVLLIIAMVGFLYISKRNNNQEQSPINIEPLQKDIEHSKEILEKQIETLNRQLEIQSEIINKFKDSYADSDKAKVEKMATLIEQLASFQGSLNKKEIDYKSSADIIKTQVTEVIKDLATLKESSMTLSKINDSVQNLQEVFINTKKRGNVGEFILENILTEMLGTNPNLWERQYQVDGGVIDAYVKTSEGKEGIAIDSKFSIDNYRKYLTNKDSKIKESYLKSFRSDIRKRIDEVAKYINAKNQISSAVMFIPSEEIFAFIYANYPKEIVDYSFKRHVWITSPTTLAAILFTINKYRKDVNLNKNIERIKKEVIKLKNELERWVDRWEKVKKGISTTNDAIKLLDITHDKLSKQYNNILEMPEELKESE